MSLIILRPPHRPNIDEIAARAAGPGASTELFIRIRNAIIEVAAERENTLCGLLGGPEARTVRQQVDFRDWDALACRYRDACLFV